jgi:hypothetical protein
MQVNLAIKQDRGNLPDARTLKKIVGKNRPLQDLQELAVLASFRDLANLLLEDAAKQPIRANPGKSEVEFSIEGTTGYGMKALLEKMKSEPVREIFRRATLKVDYEPKEQKQAICEKYDVGELSLEFYL